MLLSASKIGPVLIWDVLGLKRSGNEAVLKWCLNSLGLEPSWLGSSGIGGFYNWDLLVFRGFLNWGCMELKLSAILTVCNWGCLEIGTSG